MNQPVHDPKASRNYLRSLSRTELLDPVAQAAMDLLDPDWQAIRDVAQTDTWKRNLADMWLYIGVHGHANAKTTDTIEGRRIGNWAASQRSRYRGGILSAERIAELEALPGWVWRPRDSKFREMLAAFDSFAAREGHGDLPSTHKENGKWVGSWLARTRETYELGGLDPLHIEECEQRPLWRWVSRREELLRIRDAELDAEDEAEAA